MEETKLRQLFKNRADAYLNTIDESVEQGMSEDCFINALNEAINYTRCSTQLKDKYSADFVYFLEKKVKEQKVGSIYWYKGTGYTDLDKLFKEYQKLTKPLIV